MNDEIKKVAKLETELRLQEALKNERALSEKSYARKIYETAVIWFAVIICGAVLTALVNLVIRPAPQTQVQTQK